MSPKEKIKWVRDRINDAAQISPSGSFRVDIRSVDEYEDGPTFITRADQWSILKKIEQEGYIKNVRLDDDKHWAWMELMPKQKLEQKKTRRGTLLSHIKTTDELIQDRALFDKFLHVVGDLTNIKPKLKYDCETDERNDDLIQLLIDLKVVEYDWDKMKEQTHRQVGNRIIRFTFDGSKILALHDRVSGVGGIVRKEALQLVSKEIGDRFTMTKIVEFFTARGVPGSMFMQDTKWRAVFYALSFYTTSKLYKDHLRFLKIIQEVLHPLMFEGDEEKTEAARNKYRKLLKYDRIQIDDDGKVYAGPSEESEKVGVDDWVDADGNVIEPRAYAVYPGPLAALCVFWSQLVIIVSAYETPTLDHRELEKLYLEIIAKAEDLIEGGKVGSLQERYQRPFTSLATAEIEARAKNVKDPINLIADFLLDINALKPEPMEIAKKIEENAELLGRIIAATRVILSDEKQENLLLISYEQAIFMLKLVFDNMFNILDAVASGPINVADEELNAKYIPLWDALQKLLEREDFAELKKNDPVLPEHLFEYWGDMDVWWEGDKPSLMRFHGDIEKLWVRSGRQTFPVFGQLVELFSTIGTRVDQHHREKSARWNRMLKNIDAQKERGEFPFTSPNGTPKIEVPDAFNVAVKDREIWINDFLLSKPYAVSSNKEFFDYVYGNADKPLTRDTMPEYAKEAVRGGKGFSKVLNELGFKSEILKAFFPTRSKSALLFRKGVPTKQLAKEGINIELLLQELRTAHTRNSPK